MEQKTMKNLIFIVISVLFISAIFTFLVFASNTDGTIDSTYKYAWGENIGWINFGTSNGDVHITDSGISGSALGENTGWIYLDDVNNDGEGNLSGYAWGENIGWVSFNPTNGGVSINSSGEFAGSALGENTGWIIFDCTTSACVKTDWRPSSVRPTEAVQIPGQFAPPSIPREKPTAEKIKQELVELAETAEKIKQGLAEITEEEKIIPKEIPPEEMAPEEVSPEEIVPPEVTPPLEEIVLPPKEGLIENFKEFGRWFWQKITNFWQKI